MNGTARVFRCPTGQQWRVSADGLDRLAALGRLKAQEGPDRFGLDARAVQEWEQGRRVPDRAARVLLTVIDRDPEAVVRVLSE